MSTLDPENITLRLEILENQVVELSSRVITLSEILRDRETESVLGFLLASMNNSSFKKILIKLVKSNPITHQLARKLYSFKARKKY
jgi:hypothetical protein